MCKNSTITESDLACNELFHLFPIQNKKVEVSFTAPDLSSQGGLLLMGEYEAKCGFLSSLCTKIQDKRVPYLVRHPYESMVKQRVFQIAAGYENADDCDYLRKDSILKMCVGKTPDDRPGCSQPTMTRLENKLSTRELYDIGVHFVEHFMSSYSSEPEVIILDCDDSNFDAHGAQQGTLFNNYYHEYCYMPLFIFEGISGKMILPLLRPGRRNKSTNVFGLPRRLISMMRKQWKNTRFVVRGDSHFCSHELMDWAQNKDYVDFITGLTGNSVLNKRTADRVQTAQTRYKQTGQPVKFFHTMFYKAGSWKHQQRVLVKIEVNDMGLNIRYVVTSFKHGSSKFLYDQMYCGRGQMELYIKEVKTCLDADRTSCNSFKANQFRLFLHSAAYVLLHSMKEHLFQGSDLEKASVLTIRERILLTATHIKVIKSKIRIEFPKDHLYRKDIGTALQRLAALPKAAA